MTMHMIAYGINAAAAAGTLVAATPIEDPTVTENGDMIYVPAKYNQIVRLYSIIEAGSIPRIQAQAPSLREMYFPFFPPGAVNTSFGQPSHVTDFGQSPIQLVTNEGLEVWNDGGGTSGSPIYHIVILSDGKLTPVSGKIFTMRCTASITLTADYTWYPGSLTFAETLPVGTYQIVGMRAEGTHLKAARLLFIGSGAITRPGVPGVQSNSYVGHPEFRVGAAGVFGEFDSQNPPQIECLGNTDTSQVIYLDMIKTG